MSAATFRFRAQLPDIAIEPPQESALSSEYSKTHGREALRFEPKRFLRSVEDAPRHIILGMDAARSVRPMSAATSRTVPHRSCIDTGLGLRAQFVVACSSLLRCHFYASDLAHVAIVPVPVPSVSSYAMKVKWESKDQFYTILNLSPTGHMPGYRGLVPLTSALL